MKTGLHSALLILLLGGIALRLEAQSPKTKESFTQAVKATLESSWIELHISQALVTDYGEIHTTTISLKRDNVSAPAFRFSSHDPKDAGQSLGSETYKQLLETVKAAAEEVEQIDTPGEIIARIGAEEAARLIRERKLPSLWDVEVLVIQAVTPQGSKVLLNEGRSQKLVVYLKDTFAIKQLELPDRHVKTVLGFDPYEQEK